MAIYDQNYVRYDGPLRERGAWAVIAWMSFRTYLSFWRTKLALLLMQWILPSIFIVLLGPGVLVVMESGAMEAFGG